jgi:hypothetical protein
MRNVFKLVVEVNEDINKNPLPKKRFTRRQQHLPAAETYHEYLEHVRSEFNDAIARTDEDHWIRQYVGYDREPITDTGTMEWRMDIQIHFKGYSHGDPENIFGAIADALFTQDKYLSGSFFFDHNHKDSPSVVVEIYIP